MDARLGPRVGVCGFDLVVFHDLACWCECVESRSPTRSRPWLPWVASRCGESPTASTVHPNPLMRERICKVSRHVVSAPLTSIHLKIGLPNKAFIEPMGLRTTGFCLRNAWIAASLTSEVRGLRRKRSREFGRRAARIAGDRFRRCDHPLCPNVRHGDIDEQRRGAADQGLPPPCAESPDRDKRWTS